MPGSRGRQIVVSAIEHKSVLEAAKRLVEQGWIVRRSCVSAATAGSNLDALGARGAASARRS
jgi:cysteine sulfinate desulfinase/cysteine desulfurase-like protein